MEDVVERTDVFFLESFAQIFCGNEAAFAVGEIAAGAVAEGDERGVRESDDVCDAVDVKLCVDGVGMARGDAVPHVGEAAFVDLSREL